MVETARRREKQEGYNSARGITPESVKRGISDIVGHLSNRDHATTPNGIEDRPHMVGPNRSFYIEDLEKKMRAAAAADLEFEEAGRLRDEMRKLRTSWGCRATSMWRRCGAIRRWGSRGRGRRGMGRGSRCGRRNARGRGAALHFVDAQRLLTRRAPRLPPRITHKLEQKPQAWRGHCEEDQP